MKAKIEKDLNFGFKYKKLNFRDRITESVKIIPEDDSEYYGKILNINLIITKASSGKEVDFVIALSSKIKTTREQKDIIKSFIKTLNRNRLTKGLKVIIRKKKTKTPAYILYYRSGSEYKEYKKIYR